MVMMDVIVCASTNLFRIYIIHRFILIFLGDVKQDRKKEFLCASAFFCVNTLSYLLFHAAWLNILCNLLGIGSMVYLHTKSIKINLFITSGIYFINMACDSIAVLFVEYNHAQNVSLVYAIITVFLILICELFSEKVVNYRKNIDAVESLPLVLVPLSSIGMFLFLSNRREKPDRELVIISLGLMFINFIVFFLYRMLLKAFSQKYENELLAQIYSNQLDTMLESEARVKNLRHDIKHHLNGLKLLAANNDMHAIRNYLDDMENYIENPDEIVASGNIEIDSVLNFMLQMAKRELRSVDIKVQLPEALVHSFDINIILGNLLENAIEAARQTEEKYLGVTIMLKKEILRIEIENSFNGSLLFQKDEKYHAFSFGTTKENTKKHGMGLNSVRKIVQKYNGIMDVYSKDNRFYIKLMLYRLEK
ncbi:GHKL domain-containing protein [Lachnospiraceae bacterium]|jgi:two-component system sensor histidine kinase AgrC|nr:GHKL domain-containing protein [Lachnospiraceae bacterium]